MHYTECQSVCPPARARSRSSSDIWRSLFRNANLSELLPAGRVTCVVALLAMRQQGLRCEQPFALGTALVEVHSRRPLLRSSHHRRLATSRTGWIANCQFAAQIDSAACCDKTIWESVSLSWGNFAGSRQVGWPTCLGLSFFLSNN